MSLLSRQRKQCEDLAEAARRDREALAAARAAVAARLRRDVASPAGLLAFFAAGLVAGALLSPGRRANGAAPSRRGRRAVAAGLWLLRMLEALGGAA